MVYFVLFAAPNVLMPVLKVTLNPYLTFKNLAANYSNALMHNLQSLHRTDHGIDQGSRTKPDNLVLGTSGSGTWILDINTLRSFCFRIFEHSKNQPLQYNLSIPC